MLRWLTPFVHLVQVVASKTANAKLESELKQEKANLLDMQKILCDERKLMSTMDMEHQSHLVELEQTHQEKVCFYSLHIVPHYIVTPLPSWKHECWKPWSWMCVYWTLGQLVCLICSNVTNMSFLLQVLYLLGQLQNKPAKDEEHEQVSKREKELLQRLKFQVWLFGFVVYLRCALELVSEFGLFRWCALAQLGNGLQGLLF